MNGIHDMGGMDGFGRVHPEDGEAFHELWEKQIFVANRLVRTPPLNEGGRSTEYMDPADYLNWGYFGRSFYSLHRRVLAHGLVTEEELQNPDGRLSSVDGLDVIRAEEVEDRFRTRRGERVQVDVPPKFRVGDRVIVKNEHPRRYTRCPRYVRGFRGQVDRDRGVWPFPDTASYGLGEKPQHCYSIRFTATELWGSRADPKDRVYADLFEDYLEEAS